MFKVKDACCKRIWKSVYIHMHSNASTIHRTFQSYPTVVAQVLAEGPAGSVAKKMLAKRSPHSPAPCPTQRGSRGIRSERVKLSLGKKELRMFGICFALSNSILIGNKLHQFSPSQISFAHEVISKSSPCLSPDPWDAPSSFLPCPIEGGVRERLGGMSGSCPGSTHYIALQSNIRELTLYCSSETPHKFVPIMLTCWLNAV